MRRHVLSLIVFTMLFTMTAVGLAGEDCLSFNPNTIQVTQINGSWKIVDGSHWMFDFGTKKDDADKSFAIIKHYKMNQMCFVGRPNPPFQYMLVNGSAPTGDFPGQDCLTFNPNTIEVKQVSGSWKIVDGDHWMFDFGGNQAQAQEAFDIIKKYGFNRSCFVGRPNAKFKYLTKVGFNPVIGIKPIKPIKPIIPIRPLPVREDCVNFNLNTIEVKEIGGRWKIVDGNHWIFDFEGKKADAYKAFDIIKHYKMTQSCFVGRPNPPFQYMLSNGNAPSGSFPGEDCIAFNPDTIEVKEVSGNWKIVDGNHWMFDFGSNKANAELAFGIIKKYGFRFSCFVGRPNANFFYLKK